MSGGFLRLEQRLLTAAGRDDAEALLADGDQVFRVLVVREQPCDARDEQQVRGQCAEDDPDDALHRVRSLVRWAPTRPIVVQPAMGREPGSARRAGARPHVATFAPSPVIGTMG